MRIGPRSESKARAINLGQYPRIEAGAFQVRIEAAAIHRGQRMRDGIVLKAGAGIGPGEDAFAGRLRVEGKEYEEESQNRFHEAIR